MDTTSLPPDDQPPAASPRRRNRGLLWAAALATVVLAIATVVAFASGGDDGSSDVQQLDPNATLPTGADGLEAGADPTGQALPQVSFVTFDGEQVPLSTDGRPMVLNFWAAYCGPCIKEMPAIEQVYQANQDRVAFLGLDVAERAESGKEMLDRTGATYPVGRDPKGEVFRAFGGMGLPRTVLVAADGTIVAVHNGELSQAELQALIDDKLGV